MTTTVPVVISVRGISYADHACCAPDWRWDSRLNRWGGWLLWYAAAGRGRIVLPGVSGGTYAIVPGACFLLDLREPLRGEAERSEPPEFLAVAFTWDGPWPGWRRVRRMRAAPRLEALLEDCVDVARAGRRAARRLLGELCDRLRREPHRPWPAALLARHLDCTREHAVRLFRRHCGCAPGAWLTACRMRRARHLLRHDPAGVAAIARAVGFADPSAFARAFRRHHGCTPLAWRQRPWHEDPGNAR